MTSISFNVAKEDALALTCYYYATSPTVRRNRLKSQVAVSLILGGAGLLALVGAGEVNGAGIVGIALLVCVGVAVMYIPSWYRLTLPRFG